MMKKILLTFMAALAGAFLPALAADDALTRDILAEADSAYTADDYDVATALYRQAIDSLGTSSPIYYNLGNSLYRQGKLGEAVVAYERALRLDPSNRDARANLEFVNSRIIDRPGERGTLVGNMLDNASLSLHSNEWAWIAFAAFLLFLGALALYLFSPVVALRKTGFFGGFAVLIFAIVAAFLSARNAALCEATDVAVITAPSTILSTSPRQPRDRSEEAILLHEGTKMQILDSVTTTRDSLRQTWLDVRIDNAHRAWINRDAVEII